MIAHKHHHPAEVGQDNHPQLTALKVYTLNLPANGQLDIPSPNTHFFILAATGTVAVRGDTFGQLDGLVQGQGLNNVPFNRLSIIDQSGIANTVKVLIAPGEFTNQILQATVALSAATILAMRQSGSFAAGSFAVTTASQVLAAANPNRQYLLVQNNDPAATVYLSFGATAAAPATGVRLLPGQSYELPSIVTTQAVNIIGSAATSAVILVTG